MIGMVFAALMAAHLLADFVLQTDDDVARKVRPSVFTRHVLLVTPVGFLVAAKSIFRFGDLSRHSERATAEYILIGTLASFLWGLTASLAPAALL